MDDLLKEAIADAKAVRETALQNAKMALEEAFTPKLKSMLAQKIQQEIEDEDDAEEVSEIEDEEMEDEDEGEMEAEEAPVDEPSDEEEVSEIEDEDEDAEEVSEIEDEDEVEEGENHDEDEDEVSEEMEDEDDEVSEEMEDEDDELDLESILKELEDEIEDEDEMEEGYDDEDEDKVEENDVSSDIGKADNKVADKANDSSATGAQGPEGEGKDEPAGKELDDHEVVKEGEAHDEDEDEMEEDIDLEEVLKALSEEEDEKEDTTDELAKLQGEIKEHRDVVKYLRGKLNEVNLLNAKLLFSNKLFRAFGLSNEQKLKVVETFDRTKNIREIKLVYSTLAESFKGGKIQPVKESKGSSSKVVASTKPAKDEVLNEGTEIKNRFKKLANIL
tara:strand:- start:15593 stop:16759 length:1167 start_codon:yes stop_codon:yes gene_type:complete